MSRASRELNRNFLKPVASAVDFSSWFSSPKVVMMSSTIWRFSLNFSLNIFSPSGRKAGSANFDFLSGDIKTITLGTSCNISFSHFSCWMIRMTCLGKQCHKDPEEECADGGEASQTNLDNNTITFR